MEQNNYISNSIGGEYSFPKNKEQFRQVLRQAREGQYRQSEQEYAQPVREKYTSYEENERSRYFSELQPNTEPQRLSEEAPKVDFFDYRQPAHTKKQLTPMKKRFNPLVIILPLVLLIIAAAAVFFIFLNNTVSYRKAEENYFGALMQNCFAAKGESSENPVKAEIKISVPAAELADISVNEAVITADTVKQDEDFYGTFSTAIGKEIVTAEYWSNAENKTTVFFSPEISDISLCLRGLPVNYAEIIGDIFVKTSDSYFELVGEPKAEKDSEFIVNGSSCKADKYVIHLDGVQLASLERAFVANALTNDSAVSVLCKKMGCGTKEELLEDERIKAAFDRLEQIITGEKRNNSYLDMVVYVKNKTVIGRELTYTDAGDGTDLNVASVNMSDTNLVPNDNYNGRLILNIYEIPVEKGTLTYIDYKSLEKDGIVSEDIYISREDEVNGNDIHNGKITVGFGGNTVTLSYSDLAVTEELFQGKINITSAKDPALAVSVELKTDEDKKILEFSIPNIVTADVTLTRSDIEFKEMPELSDTEYAELSFDRDNESETAKKFRKDLERFVHRIMNIELYDEENNSDIPNKNTSTVDLPEKDNSKETGVLVDSLDNNNEETTAAEITSEDTAENSHTTVAETETTAVSETPLPTTEPVQQIQNPPAFSALDTGDAQKISGAGLDGFNSGNYYTVEIYVDGANAAGNITVSELDGDFDAYIKGKVLQIDFAEGYSFDSALIVLTFPYGTINGGRNYPYSDTLKGLDRYLVLGSEDGEGYGDKEIECYKYSANQIGFIAEGSGYYYVVDLDRYFYEEIGSSPEQVNIY